MAETPTKTTKSTAKPRSKPVSRKTAKASTTAAKPRSRTKAKPAPAAEALAPKVVHSNEAPKAAATPAATPAPKPAPKPVVVTSAVAATVSKPELKKKELIDAATERSGEKRRAVKPAIEAALAIIGQALAEGRELNLQPLGKLKINRAKEVSGGRVIVAKLRQSDRAVNGQDDMPDAAE